MSNWNFVSYKFVHDYINESNNTEIFIHKQTNEES